MKITDLDYYATYGNTFLHKIKPEYKLISLIIILTTVLIFKNIFIYILIYDLLLLFVIFSGVPRLKVLLASLYPLVFTILFLFSLKNQSIIMILMLLLRILCISTSVVIIIFTTSYIKIFKVLSGFLPNLVLNILFNTYRSIFIIGIILENLMTALKLRGNIRFSQPLESLKIIGNMIGFFIIKSLEMGEKMYESLKLRGWNDNYSFLKD